MNTAERIAKLREKRGLTQPQLAKELSVATSTIGMWETGKRGLKDESIQLLADYFDVSTDYLLGRTENMHGILDPKKKALSVQEALDSVMSYDGEPLTDNDRDVLKRIVEGYLNGK